MNLLDKMIQYNHVCEMGTQYLRYLRNFDEKYIWGPLDPPPSLSKARPSKSSVRRGLTHLGDGLLGSVCITDRCRHSFFSGKS